MKSRIIIAALAFFVFVQAQSQVTFKPGLRAGVNVSHFTKGIDFDNQYYYVYEDPFYPNVVPYSSRIDYSDKVDFYIGFYGALRLTKYYTLQPEINYSRQGSKVEFISNNIRTNSKVDISYLSTAVINKFTFSEKFNVHFGPTIDFVVDKSRNTLNGFADNPSTLPSGQYYSSNHYGNNITAIDLAFVAGFGFNFTRNIGIEARIKKGIVPVIDDFESNNTNVVYSLGATYTFDLK